MTSGSSSPSRESFFMRKKSLLGPPSLFPLQRSFEPHSTSTSRPISPIKEERKGFASQAPFLQQDDVDLLHETSADLDFYYGLVKRQLLRFQSPTTFLYPEMSGNSFEGCVRSSIYANMAVWSLSQAYKRIDDDRGKSYELSQSTVAGMRGILNCWMKQSSKLERFKSKQTGGNALHSKFHLDTGEELYNDRQYNHLQIDVVSLYLLFLTQVISSGLNVIFSREEVKFVQNLVYYVERAYRTPDFGMWERGTKFNDGTCEVHASSIGLAKAALEAINGCNMFGKMGGSSSVIYVDIDAHNRNRSIFQTLLPRESYSKSTDAAILPTISFPAFATHEKSLYESAKKNCIENLEGKYGFKRFLRDGYGSVLEPDGCRFYPEGYIQRFGGVESEWPIFFTYMVIDGVFRQDEAQIDEYLEKIKHKMSYNEFGDPVFPKYYYVPAKEMAAERKEPGSAHRLPSNNGCSSNDLFIWGQAMLIISDLLTTKLLHVYELDPIRRSLPSYNRPKNTNRYSAFQAPLAGLVLQVVTIAESRRLKSVLATYGIQSQTPNEIEPVKIWNQKEMVKVFKNLGASEVLGLSGRPPRPLGALGTSKVYRLLDQTVLCYPLIFSDSEFYMSHDMALLTEDIKSELKFVSKCWRLSGRPTVCIIVTENHMRDPQFPVLLDLLAKFSTGTVEGVKLRVGRVQNLLASCCIEHLDFLHHSGLESLDFTPFQQLKNEISSYMTLTDIPVLKPFKEESHNFLSEFKNKQSQEISSTIMSCSHLYGSIQLLGILLERHGSDYMVGDMTVNARLEDLNRKAGSSRHWAAVRYASSLLRKTVESISPFVTQILVNGKQVAVGTIGVAYALFDKPMTPAEIKSAIYEKVQPNNTIAAVLQQELILHCGKLIATNPELFEGILKIRIGWFLYGLELYRKMKLENPDSIESCSPSEIRHVLVRVLTESKALQLSYDKMKPNDFNMATNDESLTVYQVRKINGCLNRVPNNFFKDMWLILTRAPGGIYIGKTHISQEPTLTQFSSNEENFANMAESAFNDLHDPEYKQLSVELLCVLARILKRNPELEFLGKLCVDTLIEEAIGMFKKDESITNKEEKQIFYNSPVHKTSGYLARAVLNSLLKGCLSMASLSPLNSYFEMGSAEYSLGRLIWLFIILIDTFCHEDRWILFCRQNFLPAKYTGHSIGYGLDTLKLRDAGHCMANVCFLAAESKVSGPGRRGVPGQSTLSFLKLSLFRIGVRSHF